MLMKSLLSSTDKKMLQQAITHELTASSMYKQLGNCMQKSGYFGAQKYFLSESADELVHYQKIADFMNDRGDEAQVPAIPEQKGDIDELKEAFQTAFDAEVELDKFYQKSYKNSDDVSVQEFLLAFIKIQRKSVGEYMDLLATIERCENNPSALITFDFSLK